LKINNSPSVNKSKNDNEQVTSGDWRDVSSAGMGTRRDHYGGHHVVNITVGRLTDSGITRDGVTRGGN